MSQSIVTVWRGSSRVSPRGGFATVASARLWAFEAAACARTNLGIPASTEIAYTIVVGEKAVERVSA